MGIGRFTIGAAKRVSRGIVRLERMPIATQPEEAGGRHPGAIPIVRAVVTTVIPSGTITDPSTTGRANVYRWDNEADTSSIESSADWQNIRVCNDHTLPAAVPLGTVVKLGWSDGDYWLIASDCY